MDENLYLILTKIQNDLREIHKEMKNINTKLQKIESKQNAYASLEKSKNDFKKLWKRRTKE